MMPSHRQVGRASQEGRARPRSSWRGAPTAPLRTPRDSSVRKSCRQGLSFKTSPCPVPELGQGTASWGLEPRAPRACRLQHRPARAGRVPLLQPLPLASTCSWDSATGQYVPMDAEGLPWGERHRPLSRTTGGTVRLRPLQVAQAGGRVAASLPPGHSGPSALPVRSGSSASIPHPKLHPVPASREPSLQKEVHRASPRIRCVTLQSWHTQRSFADAAPWALLAPLDWPPGSRCVPHRWVLCSAPSAAAPNGGSAGLPGTWHGRWQPQEASTASSHLLPELWSRRGCGLRPPPHPSLRRGGHRAPALAALGTGLKAPLLARESHVLHVAGVAQSQQG